MTINVSKIISCIYLFLSKVDKIMFLMFKKNLCPIANEISSGQASKDGRFEDDSNMEYSDPVICTLHSS